MEFGIEVWRMETFLDTRIVNGVDSFRFGSEFSWSTKKQGIAAKSSAEASYVAA